MNRVLFLFLILFNTVDFYSQSDKVISYFDASGHLASVEESFYYRESTDTLNFYRSYYSENKSLFFTGKILQANDSLDVYNKYNDLCIWYYKNGNKKMSCYYNEKGIKEGESIEYYENGKPSKLLYYSDGRIRDLSYTAYDNDNSSINVTEEDFSNNFMGWNLVMNNLISNKIKIGGLEILNKSDKSCSVLSPFKVDSLEYNVKVRVNTKSFSASGKAGLLFNYIDNNNYNYFFISKSRYYVGYVEEGKRNEQVEEFYSLSIKDYDWNTLDVMLSRDTFYYYINGNLHIELKKLEFTGKAIGFCVSHNSNSIFDDLVINQYANSRSSKNTSQIEKLVFNNQTYAVQTILNGLLFSSKGHILTSYDDVKNYYKMVVGIYVNDTLKEFNAEVLLKDALHNLAVLKISNSDESVFNPPAFSFLKVETLKLETELVAYYLSKNNFNEDFKVSSFEGKLKSFACYENFNIYFESSIPKNKLPYGTPIFTSKGEFLGIVSDSNNLKSINSRAVKFQYFKTFFPAINDDIELKKTLPLDQEKFKKGIEKNIVYIKTI